MALSTSAPLNVNVTASLLDSIVRAATHARPTEADGAPSLPVPREPRSAARGEAERPLRFSLTNLTGAPLRFWPAGVSQPPTPRQAEPSGAFAFVADVSADADAAAATAAAATHAPQRPTTRLLEHRDGRRRLPSVRQLRQRPACH